MAGGGDASLAHGDGHAAVDLTRMGAVGVATAAKLVKKFGKGGGQVLQREEIKAEEVQHAKSRRIGKEAPLGRHEQLDAPRGVAPTRDLAADVPGRQRKRRKKTVEKGGFPDAGGTGKGGTAAVPDILGNVRGKRRGVKLGREDKDRKAGRAVDGGKLLGGGAVKVGLRHDHHRGDTVMHRNGRQLIEGIEGGRRVAGGGDDKEKIGIGKRRTDKGGAARQDLLDDRLLPLLTHKAKVADEEPLVIAAQGAPSATNDAPFPLPLGNPDLVKPPDATHHASFREHRGPPR